MTSEGSRIDRRAALIRKTDLSRSKVGDCMTSYVCYLPRNLPAGAPFLDAAAPRGLVKGHSPTELIRKEWIKEGA